MTTTIPQPMDHPRFVSVDQVVCPTWCTADHTADLATTNFVCDVVHAGPRLEPAPFGPPDSRGGSLAAAELEATTDDSGQVAEVSVYFWPAGEPNDGGELTLSELHQAAEVMRQQAGRLDAYADQVANLIETDAGSLGHESA